MLQADCSCRQSGGKQPAWHWHPPLLQHALTSLRLPLRAGACAGQARRPVQRSADSTPLDLCRAGQAGGLAACDAELLLDAALAVVLE